MCGVDPRWRVRCGQRVRRHFGDHLSQTRLMQSVPNLISNSGANRWDFWLARVDRNVLDEEDCHNAIRIHTSATPCQCVCVFIDFGLIHYKTCHNCGAHNMQNKAQQRTTTANNNCLNQFFFTTVIWDHSLSLLYIHIIQCNENNQTNFWHFNYSPTKTWKFAVHISRQPGVT